MKFSFVKEDVIDDLLYVNSVVPQRNTMPILGSLLFNITTGGGVVIASNMDVTLSAFINVKTETPRSICIEAKPFISIVSKMYGEVSVEIKSKRAIIKSKTGRYECPAYASEEFPYTDILDTQSIGVADSSILINGLRNVSHAIGKDDSAPIVSCYYLDAKDKNIVATDRVFLAISSFEPELSESVILPSSVVPFIKMKGDINISTTEYDVVMFDGKRRLVYKRVNGKYYQYMVIYNSLSGGVIEIDSDELKRVVSAVSVCAPSVYHKINFEFAPTNVTITSEDIDFGLSAKESIPCKSEYVGNISVNGSGLMNTLSKYSGEIQLKINDSAKPMLVGDNTRLKTIILPIQ